MRALILCPARELALQVLKVGKDLARSLATGPQALSWSLVMGGESLEAQFEAMSSNPDMCVLFRDFADT
jgi:ATP-dependent RNA helicase DDX54/DBP10